MLTDMTMSAIKQAHFERETEVMNKLKEINEGFVVLREWMQSGEQDADGNYRMRVDTVYGANDYAAVFPTFETAERVRQQAIDSPKTNAESDSADFVILPVASLWAASLPRAGRGYWTCLLK